MRGIIYDRRVRKGQKAARVNPTATGTTTSERLESTETTPVRGLCFRRLDRLAISSVPHKREYAAVSDRLSRFVRYEHQNTREKQTPQALEHLPHFRVIIKDDRRGRHQEHISHHV